MKLLYIIIGIVLIPFVVALFLKKEYTVVRSVEVNKPIGQTFGYLKLLKNQDDFSSWAEKDPNMKTMYTGNDGEVGFVSRWESEDKDVGVGEQEIVKITEGERIDYEMRFYKPFEATDSSYITTKSLSENKTEVVWGFQGKMNYPMNLMLLFMDMDKTIGTEFESSLGKLKTILEK